MHPKKIFLMRHAHSEAQDCKKMGLSRTDSALLDCHITKIGEFQAKTAWKEEYNLPELIVVSPLTRAIETVLIAFEGFGIPVICHPELREMGGDKLPENCLRDKRELLRDKKLRKYSEFGNVDLTLISEKAEKKSVKCAKRVNFMHDSLIKWLKARPEECILLVTHLRVIKELLPMIFEEIENTKVFEANLYAEGYNLIKSELI